MIEQTIDIAASNGLMKIFIVGAAHKEPAPLPMAAPCRHQVG